MALFDGTCREVLDTTEFVAIVTNGLEDPRIQLLVASRRAEGSQGPGQGCLIKGTSRIVTSGDEMDRVKARFAWARAALVVQVEEATAQL